jgi:hypothetical protein
VPQALVNLLSTANFTWDLIYHYQALPMAAMGLGMVEGVGRIKRWRPGLTTFAVGATVACALAASCAWGISPISRDYHVGYWPLSARTEQSALDAAVARVGPSDGVAADYNFVPHLTHRDIIYTFPNPWQNKNFGVSALSSGDPAKVRWLVVDTSHFQPSDLELFDQITDSGEFEVRQTSAIPGIDPFGHPARLVVAERVRPPTNATGPPPTAPTPSTTQP